MSAYFCGCEPQRIGKPAGGYNTIFYVVKWINAAGSDYQWTAMPWHFYTDKECVLCQIKSEDTKHITSKLVEWISPFPLYASNADEAVDITRRIIYPKFSKLTRFADMMEEL